ncbi:MAG: ABC transporter substrate-binding protein [Flavobacteriales bacterium]
MYAKGFYIRIDGADSTLILRNPQDTASIYAELNISSKKNTGLTLPLKRITSLSATHLAFLSKLQKENTLVGFAGLQYVRVPSFKSLVDSGKIKELGLEDKINIEELIAIKPDVFMCYPTASNSFHTIKQSGIPVLPLPDYFESHPLARAEYVVLFGILTGKTKESVNVFNRVKEQYVYIKNAQGKKEYTSIAGKPIDGTWYVPAGQSYVAQFLNDAGSTYTFNEVEGTNVVTKQIEEVISTANKTDFWFFIHSAPESYSRQTLVNEHPSVASLTCYKNNHIFMCNSESVDIFGEGIMEPHIILHDLVYALYPAELKAYKPKYFKPLTAK